jgi:hypothetical protein
MCGWPCPVVRGCCRAGCPHAGVGPYPVGSGPYGWGCVVAAWPKRVTVGTSAVRIDDPETTQWVSLILCNRSSNSVFLGGPGVTVSVGFELLPGDMLTVRMQTAQGGLFAVASAGSNRLDRLQVSW